MASITASQNNVVIPNFSVLDLVVAFIDYVQNGKGIESCPPFFAQSWQKLLYRVSQKFPQLAVLPGMQFENSSHGLRIAHANELNDELFWLTHPVGEWGRRIRLKAGEGRKFPKDLQKFQEEMFKEALKIEGFFAERADQF